MILIFLIIITFISYVYSCTSLGVGKKATVDGSTYISHSNDGEDDTDPRLVLIPAKDHADGALRPIYWAPENFPRYVGYDRGAEAYYPKPGENISEPIGHIPEVSHTYQYFEETYAVLNEHGLAIGESTCSSRFGTVAVKHGGKALLSVDTLSQLAMERCKTARDAIITMGKLSEKYGFYGPGSTEGSGESLMVSDPNEVYVFHILSDPDGISSIWAAQKIEYFSIVANMYIIREIDFNNSDKFLYSSNIKDIAIKHNLWTKGTPFDFTKIYSDGEYKHKYYSGRRQARALNLVNSSLNLNYTYDNLLYNPYPVEVIPENLLTYDNVSSIMRDYYQNTPYDLTKGLAAGPFGTPDRYSDGIGSQQVHGHWERAIGMYRTSDSYVVQGRNWLPTSIGSILWFAPHAAHGSVYTPFAAGMELLPYVYSIGHQLTFERKSAFWAFRYVENLANLKFSYIIQDINAARNTITNAAIKLQSTIDQEYIKDNDITLVTDKYISFADRLVKRWWDFADEIMFKYSDGYINEGKDQLNPGYPAWWLKQVNYTSGPPDPPAPPKQQRTIQKRIK